MPFLIIILTLKSSETYSHFHLLSNIFHFEHYLKFFHILPIYYKKYACETFFVLKSLRIAWRLKPPITNAGTNTRYMHITWTGDLKKKIFRLRVSYVVFRFMSRFIKMLTRREWKYFANLLYLHYIIKTSLYVISTLLSYWTRLRRKKDRIILYIVQK